MEYLGLDVSMQIFYRLSVKDLMRLKSVSKTLLNIVSSLISIDEFIRLHLEKSSFRAIYIYRSAFMYCKQADRVYGLMCFTTSYGSFTTSYGSCNGLVCLWLKQDNNVLLWNPALRQAEFIPIKRPQQTIYSCWFGYDNDEYKLILGTDSHVHLIRLCIDTDAWKSYNIDKNYSHNEFMGTLVHLTVHWPALYNENGKSTIISYDLRNEMVGKIATPDALTYDYDPFVLGQVDGCLSIIFEQEFDMELWVMREYGVKESWTKLMNLPFNILCTYRHYSKPYVVELDDPAQLASPIYGKDFYVESLISPRSIKAKMLLV